jgi:orotidine-5'-phosphate decarboxylase
MTPAERKRRQRELDAREGIREVTVRVPAERVPELRRIAAQWMAAITPGITPGRDR